MPDIKLNQRQFDKLSDIFSDIALVTLASIVLPSVIDKLDMNRLILGAISTILLWLTSLLLRK